MFTRFSDMCSGGSVKIKGAEWIIIEASEDDAVAYFEKRFDRDPYNVTCDCCGGDYSIDEYETLEKCMYRWMDVDKTLIICKEDMKG